MLGYLPIYDSASTLTAPDIVFVQAIQSIDSAVTLDPARPWHQFIDGLAAAGQFRAHHLSAVRRTYEEIRQRVGRRLPLPVTQPTQEGAIQLAWDDGARFVDVEVFADGTMHWYYRDRSRGQIDGTDDEPVRGVPVDLVARLIELLGEG